MNSIKMFSPDNFKKLFKKYCSDIVLENTQKYDFSPNYKTENLRVSCLKNKNMYNFK